MTLAVGDRLGPYEIIALLGKGGMGEVYRAHDARLKRDVAIKTSVQKFSERFEREARAIAALNHPNVCTLYDIGPDYLVMELVEGASPKGPMPLAEALRVAGQIAAALGAAHEKGIVHRDLKPANIKITPSGTVKVLDFGLAKVTREASADGSTVTMGLTELGAAIGTPAYMSPEQVQSKDVDKRADVWAFGVVLYELVTGSRPFKGDSVQATLTSVLVQEADVDKAPTPLQRLLRACLKKDPGERLSSIGDWRLLLDESREAKAPRRNLKLAWGVAGTLAAALVLSLVLLWPAPKRADGAFEYAMLPPDGTTFLHVSRGGPPALSPDGQSIAFVAERAGITLLWVRSLDGQNIRSLAGTEGASNPFWSADGRSIGFFAQDELKRVDPVGGMVQTIATGAKGVWKSGSWNADGKILYDSLGVTNALALVDWRGGEPVRATERDVSLLDENHLFPSFLPDGRQYLFSVRGGPELEFSIWLGSLDSKNRKLLAKNSSYARYAPPLNGSPGHLLFLREGNLVAQSFDEVNGSLSGEIVTIASHIANDRAADFAVSPAGVLAYRTSEPPSQELVWYDRSGNIAGTIGDRPGDPRNNLRISPDGKSIAFTRQARETREVWVHDRTRGVTNRLTAGRSPVWSPDGSQVFFVRGDAIYRMPASGGAETQVWKGPHLLSVNDCSGDGQYLLLTRWDDKAVRQTWLLADPLTNKPTSEATFFVGGIHAQFGPSKGTPRWVSYDDGGESHVRGMPGDASGPWQVSVNGGNGTRFRADARELYFVDGSRRSLMAVGVEPGPGFRAGAPHALFPIPRAILAGQGQWAQGWDVTSDGSMFIATFPASETPAAAITIVKNWQARLNK